MKLPKTKATKAKLESKPASVKITEITSQLLPNATGGFGIMVIGLGTDQKVYTYNGNAEVWQPIK